MRIDMWMGKWMNGRMTGWKERPEFGYVMVSPDGCVNRCVGRRGLGVHGKAGRQLDGVDPLKALSLARL